MAPATRSYDLARAVLDAIVSGWPTPGDAEPLPARQYVAFGLTSWDCEQFTVSIERTFAVEADVASELLNTGALFYMTGATFAVSLVRCVPHIDITDLGDAIFPDPADIETAARITMVDAETIRDILITAQQSGSLGPCNGISFENWTADGPEGAFGGGTQRVRLALF